MKRRTVIAVLLAAAACILLLPGSGTTDKAKGRKLTVMVYMCGSDLESEHGSASTEIEEMMNSGFQPGEVSVLVMMGGSKSWRLIPDSSGITIMEIGSGVKRRVHETEQRNMGEASTLTSLLEYGKNNYPAENYALILWDHGGGPMAGMCRDELYSDDSLTLPELTQGIRKAYLPKKLSWIGFDACLMGSAEVAASLAPYAEYMIASQETEPAEGWNYAFLKYADGEGAETGRRIVDSYFEALPDSRDPLTMACIRLDGMENVIFEMDSFFAEVESSISEESFSGLSGIRSAVSGFGRAVRIVGDGGYDLVDLGDLISRYETDASALKTALADSVVYARSSGITACGMSVYHPYRNKSRYLETWRSEYRKLGFSRGYTRYQEHFGTILTGKRYVDWSGMRMDGSAAGEEETQTFELQLSEEQTSDFLSGELMILKKETERGGTVSLSMISAGDIIKERNGLLTAAYEGEALYVLDEEGKILAGPISFLRSEDTGEYLVFAIYHDYSAAADTKKEAAVLYRCVLNAETRELEAVRREVLDTVSGNYTNRIAFSEKGYTHVEFFRFIRKMPDTVLAIPGFDEWEYDDGLYRANIVGLPVKWRLGFRDDWNSDLYAMFQITDIRQNTWSSVPIALNSPKEKIIQTFQSIPETEGIDVRCEAVLKQTTLYPSLRISVNISNSLNQSIHIRSSYPVLNGTRTIQEKYVFQCLEPGKNDIMLLEFSNTDLTGIRRVDTLDFVLSVTRYEDGGDLAEIPVHLDFSSGIVSAAVQEPPGIQDEFRREDSVWRLISMNQNTDGSISGMMYVRNTGPKRMNLNGLILINGVWVLQNQVSVVLEPGTDAYIPFNMENSDRLLSITGLHAGNNRKSVLMGLNQALEQAGVTNADQVDLYFPTDTDTDSADFMRITLRMKDGVSLQPREEKPEPAVLLNSSGITVFLEQAFIADDGIGLGLRLKNDTDEFVRFSISDPVLDEKSYQSIVDVFYKILPPRSTLITCVAINTYDKESGDPAGELRVTFLSGNTVSNPAIIRFPQGSVFGAEDGTFLSAEQLGVTTASFREEPMLLNEEIRMTDSPVHPVYAEAPANPEQAAEIREGYAALCAVGKEKDSVSGAVDAFGFRIISAAPLEQKNGKWSATLSGLSAVVQGNFLRLDETRLSDRSWQLEPGSVFFFKEKEENRQTALTLMLRNDAAYSDIRLTAEIREDGTAVIQEKRVRIQDRNFNDKRTNRYLSDCAEAVTENRVYTGTGRNGIQAPPDYTELHSFSPEEPVTVSLVPYETIPGTKGLLYILTYTDGSQERIVVDTESGETLYQCIYPAKQHSKYTDTVCSAAS